MEHPAEKELYKNKLSHKSRKGIVLSVILLVISLILLCVTADYFRPNIWKPITHLHMSQTRGGGDYIFGDVETFRRYNKPTDSMLLRCNNNIKADAFSDVQKLERVTEEYKQQYGINVTPALTVLTNTDTEFVYTISSDVTTDVWTVMAVLYKDSAMQIAVSKAGETNA